MKLLLPLLLFGVATLAGCAPVRSPAPESSEQKMVDESSINNVWHQAKLRGVAFRAVGQEPGWLLEITDGSEIIIVSNYGQNRAVYLYAEPTVYVDERRTIFELEVSD